MLYPGIGIEEFTEISTQLVEPLEDFFNNVFVMVVSWNFVCSHTLCSSWEHGFDFYNWLLQEEERVRKNRLALLNNIASLPSGIADLSFLPGFWGFLLVIFLLSGQNTSSSIERIKQRCRLFNKTNRHALEYYLYDLFDRINSCRKLV